MTDFILNLIQSWGYGGIFVLMFLENVFPPIPSEVIMGLGGIAVAKALAEGRRGGLERLAVTGPKGKGGDAPITPCGRCRQVLNEIAHLGGPAPAILCVGAHEVMELRLSDLLPHGFGPAHLD